MFSYQLYPYSQLIHPQMTLSLAQMMPQSFNQPPPNPFFYMPSPGYILPHPQLQDIRMCKSLQIPSDWREEGPSKHNSCKEAGVEQKSVKRVQNPNRNIYTNITNLILNFMISSKKVEAILRRVDPTLIQDKLQRFYQYIKDLKNQFSAYYNIDKVKKLFLGVTLHRYDREFHKIFRIVVRIILEEKIPKCLITSKRLSAQLRLEHLRARRTMLQTFTKNSPREEHY